MFFLKFLFFATLSFVIFVILLNGYMYLFQDSLIFNIKNFKPQSNISIGSNYKEVLFESYDGYTFKCWHLKAQGEEKKPLLLYFIGRNQHIGKLTIEFDKVVQELNIDLFTCNNRGYGYTGEKPSEAGFYKDAEMYFKHVKSIDPPYIFVYGRSMGGAIAIELIKRHQNDISGLIINNTFLSIQEISKHFYPFLNFFLFIFDMLRTKMDNKSKIAEIHIPTLFNVSEKDEVIPQYHMKTLYNLSPSKNKFIYVSEKGTHYDITIGDNEGKYFASFNKFIKTAIMIKKQEKADEL